MPLMTKKTETNLNTHDRIDKKQNRNAYIQRAL